MRATGIRNVRLILPDTVLHGHLLWDEEGNIHTLAPGDTTIPGLMDGQGDYLLPGLVDVHTDNLERQVLPRTQVRWPSRSAYLAHDSQCVAAGITTVADALCVGDAGFEAQRIQTLMDALNDLPSLSQSAQFRADHVLHLRCELPTGNLQGMLEHCLERVPVQMVSLMDHTPGVGQHANMDKFRSAHRAEGLSEQELERRIGEAQARRARYSEANRCYVLERFSGESLALASHDDRSVEEIQRNAADGIQIAEFPVTAEAAAAAIQMGMRTVAGAPNIIRGGSHSGNVRVQDLVSQGSISVLASDYYPSALLEAAFKLPMLGILELPQAVAMVSHAPAQMLGLTDRGALAQGLRADLLRVREVEGQVLLRGVWRGGERVA